MRIARFPLVFVFFAVALLAVLALVQRPAEGYVEAPYPLARVIAESTNILVMRVEKVDKTNNTIIYRKVRDIKGTHPGDTIKHNIARAGFAPREWQNIMAWAEEGKLALFFHNGGAGETCIDKYWYQTYAGDWWAMSHAEPYLLRSFAGRPERLADAVVAIQAGQEVAVPCMVDGDKEALQQRTAKIQRLKVSLKVQDYNPQRDFAGWGVEEFMPVVGMPGFTLASPIPRTDPGAAGIAPADFDGDGKADFCTYGESRVALLQNTTGAFNEIPLPVERGARAADWADFNGDGKPDLLLVTPLGPRLFLNEGGGKFKDVSAALPQQDYYHLTAGAWIDADADGKPDILLADGFRGLRLLRNKGPASAQAGVPKPGKWYLAGPFDNTDQKGFDAVYPPELGVDLKKEYAGKNGEKVTWREAAFADGQNNNLMLFKPECNENSVAYVYREFDSPGAADLPVSLGSDDTLTVWLNGVKIHAENVYRGCAPDQALLTLKLKPGRNALLLKICQGAGDFAFYFAVKDNPNAIPQLFEDVSDRVGLGERGIAGRLRGDRIAVADVNADGRQDFLYSAGSGVLVLNTPRGFVERTDSGISYTAGGVAPVFGDFNADRAPDLFVPQSGKCRLFRNDGRGFFRDVTDRSGAVALPVRSAVCAAWADFNNSGRLDLVVGCLKEPNRYLRNNGDGTFSDASAEIGLHRRVFNSRALAAVDLNKDGVLDLVMNNEGQESAALIGNPARIAAPPAK